MYNTYITFSIPFFSFHPNPSICNLYIWLCTYCITVFRFSSFFLAVLFLFSLPHSFPGYTLLFFPSPSFLPFLCTSSLFFISCAFSLSSLLLHLSFVFPYISLYSPFAVQSSNFIFTLYIKGYLVENHFGMLKCLSSFRASHMLLPQC